MKKEQKNRFHRLLRLKINFYQMHSMRGKVAVVTGASGALGRAVAERLVRGHGASVALISHSRPVPLENFVPQASTPPPVAFQCDVTNAALCQELFRKISRKLGPTALVVHCSGVTLSKVFLRCSEIDYDSVMNVNLRGALNVSQAALRYGGLMSKEVEASGGGSVVLLGSVVGTRGNEGQVLYSASKAALSGAVMSLAKEYGSKKVRFNVVAPGLIEGTEMCTKLSDAQRDGFVRMSALQRCAKVEEVADAVLAVGLSTFINGTTVEVTGGT